MKAVVLAAGEGTRLRPRTERTPKPLLTVAGRPILTHVFETVLDMGITEAVVVIGYEGEEIVDHYGDAYGALALEYATQPARKGLAHAVLMADQYIDGDFVVLNGDNIYGGNLQAVVEHHTDSNADITFPTEEVSREQAREGAVCAFDNDGTVSGLVEKPEEPPSRTVPAACYVLPPELFHACRLVQPSARGEYELPDAIDLLITAGYAVATLPFEGWKININTEADLDRAKQRLQES